MQHRLIKNFEQALGWDGPEFDGFAVGTLPDADLATRLLTPERLLDMLLRHVLGRPKMYCLRNGEYLSPELYSRIMSSGISHSVSVVDPNAFGKLLDEGLTVVTEQLDVMDPTIELATRALTWRVGEELKVISFLTTGSTTGYELHWDNHDVIAIQLAGTKSWEVRKPSRRSPTFHGVKLGTPPEDFLGTPPDEVLWSGTMHPGQAMYIPRGYWHKPTRRELEDGLSLHLTFRFTKRTGNHWLAWLADRAQQDLFRDDLPANPLDPRQHDTVTAHTEALTTRAHEVLNDYTPAMMIAERQRTAPPARHVHLGERWAGPVEAVIAILDYPPQFEITESEVIVRGGEKNLTFDLAAEEPLRILLSGQPVILDPVIGQPEQSDKPDLRALARTLLKEGLCAPMTEVLWAGCADMIPTAN